MITPRIIDVKESELLNIPSGSGPSIRGQLFNKSREESKRKIELRFAKT